MDESMHPKCYWSVNNEDSKDIGTLSNTSRLKNEHSAKMSLLNMKGFGNRNCLPYWKKTKRKSRNRLAFKHHHQHHLWLHALS